MSKQAQQIQIFYKIAMSIGSSLNLNDMLKSALLAYLRPLNCVAGIVFRITSNEKSKYSFKQIFSIPYTLKIGKNYKEIEDVLLKLSKNKELDEIHAQLPVSGQIKRDVFYHIMKLSDFGCLVLIKNSKPLSNDVLLTLRDVNNKLAQACFACINNDNLIDSEKKYRDLIEYLPVMICETNIKGHITFANKFSLQKMGYTQKDIEKGVNYSKLFHPDENERLKKGFAQAFDNPYEYPNEFQIITKNGETRSAIVYTNKLQQDRKTVGYRGVMIDITERKESEEKYSIITQSSMDVIFTLDKAGIIGFVNKSVEKVLGYEPEEVIAKSFMSFIPKNEGKAYLSVLSDVYNEKTIIGFISKIYHKHGHLLDIEINGHLIKQQGKYFALCSVRDISYRKDAELVLQQNLAQQVLLSNISLELNSTVGFEERILSTLEKIGKLTNVSRVYVIEGASEGSKATIPFEWCNTNIPPQKDRLQNILQKALSLWKPILKERGYVYAEDISELPDDLKTLLEGQNIKSIIGYPLYVHGVFHGFFGLSDCNPRQTWSKSELELFKTVSSILSNAYERKIMELSIMNERDKANIANKAKSEFLANMSHEIRTPMNAIMGFSEALYHKLKSAEYKNMTKSILSSGNLLLSLLNDILDLSKIEAGKLEISLQPVDLDNLIQEIILLFTDKANKKGLQISSVISQDFPEAVNLDEIRMKQVIFNLVGNALKFTHQGFVAIRTNYEALDNQKGKVMIEVEDTGIGIEKKYQKLIFDAFAQKSGQSTRGYEGAGLGLTISRRLVEKMNGTISIKSKPGEGSIFTVQIPDVTKITGYKRRADKIELNKGLVFEKSTLLVIDDVLSNIEIIEGYLHSENLVVSSAENGETGLQILKHITPDLILLDMRMPGINGYEVAKRIKSNPKISHIPVIAFTASVFSSEKLEASPDFDGVLFKPVSRNALISELVKHLNHTYKHTQTTSIPISVSPENIPKELVDKLPEIIQTLRTVFLPQWEDLRTHLILFKIEEFANQLKSYAMEIKFLYLTNYADEILSKLKIIDIEALSESLKQFPDIIEYLNEQIN